MGSDAHYYALNVPMYRHGVWQEINDVVSREECVCISAPGSTALGSGISTSERCAELWAHPVDLDRLVLGFVQAEWASLGEQARIISRKHIPVGMDRIPSHVFQVDFSLVQAENHGTAEEKMRVCLSGEQIHKANERFIREKGLWDGTGCFHRASVYAPDKDLFLYRAEDIARHNCLDRLAGWALSEKEELAFRVVFVSARVTAGLCVKALKCGVRFLVSRSAVTSAAVEFAVRNDLTLLGFCRESEHRFTVFHNAGRVAYNGP
jgi:FdhD protein